MKIIAILFSILFFSSIVLAQFVDDFSDGNFSDNPAWTGDISRFQVNAGELQLFDQLAGSSNLSYLYAPVATSTDDSTTWEFSFHLEFSPSSNNYAKVYLAASDIDLGGSQNGYFIKIGGISGSDDAIELFRQDGTSTAVLIAGTSGGVGSSPAAARVRVTRSTTGHWELWADYAGGTDFQLEGETTDDTYSFGNYFGIVCKYSSTRNEHFFFDDIYVNPLYVDTTPPEVLGVTALSAYEVKVDFNEPIAVAGIGDFFIYEFGTAISATILEGHTSVKVSFLNTTFESGVTYTLKVRDIQDESGNISDSSEHEFVYYYVEEAVEYDILINEIMADPTPGVLLPEAEFVELYNVSEKIIDLEGFGFSSGSTPKLLPHFLLFPDKYVILCDEDDADDFDEYGDVVALANFPALTNSHDQLTLTDKNGEIVHFIEYSANWYGNDQKAEGGWSLEMINPLSPCVTEGNWQAARDISGGTPGNANSVMNVASITDGAILQNAFVDNDEIYEVELTFDRALEIESASDIHSYQIDNAVEIINAAVQLPAKKKVILTVVAPFSSGITYTVTALNVLKDCIGNEISEANKAFFGVPEIAESKDLVINEILFNPESGGSDFVEIYNRSDKIFDISDFTIGNFHPTTDSNTVSVYQRLLVFPKDYIVITKDVEDLQNRFVVKHLDRVVENSLPAFANEYGNVTLYRNGADGAVVIDAFDYDEDYHHVLLDDKNGVSLERISAMSMTNDSNNWHSASKQSGYGTPTSENSQSVDIQFDIAKEFELNNTTFSPDADGYEDFLLIKYLLEKNGYVANVKVFDAEGRLVKNLFNNELLGRQGSLKWDGDNDSGQKVSIGIYIIWMQIFAPDGEVKEFRKACVVAGKF